MAVQRQKRGRKPVPLEQQRRQAVTCRLTDTERLICDQRRGALTRGEWLRIGALSSLPPIIPVLNLEAWRDLSRVAGNLATIAVAMRGGEYRDIQELQALVGELRRALIGIRGENEGNGQG